MTTYQYVHKQTFIEIEIRDRLLLKKKEETLQESMDRTCNPKPKDRRNIKDIPRTDPRPIQRRDIDF